MHGSDELSVWIAAAGAGSVEALGLLLESFRNYLLRVAEAELDSALRVKAGASDLVQKTFLEAHRDFSQFKGATKEELQAWLRRLLLNNLADHVRDFKLAEKRALLREVPLAFGDRRYGGQESVVDGSASPSSAAIRNEVQELLEAALRRLPGDYQEAVRLRHQEQLDFGEIGRRLGRTANGARKLWARAVEQLREEFRRERDAAG